MPTVFMKLPLVAVLRGSIRVNDKFEILAAGYGLLLELKYSLHAKQVNRLLQECFSFY